MYILRFFYSILSYKLLERLTGKLQLKLSGRHITINTLIMKNLVVLSNHNECIKTFRPMPIYFRLQRCCYQAFSGHMPAMMCARIHFLG